MFASKRHQVGSHSRSVARRKQELIKISNFTRLETRTKESNMYANLWVIKPDMKWSESN